MLNGWNTSSHSTLLSTISQENSIKIADALSRRHLLLFRLDACILGFKHLKSLYATDEDLGELYPVCLKHPKGEFLVHNKHLFKGTCWVFLDMVLVSY